MSLTPERVAELLLGFETIRRSAHLAQKDPRMKTALAETMLVAVADGSMWRLAVFNGQKPDIAVGREPTFVHHVVEELLRQHAAREAA